MMIALRLLLVVALAFTTYAGEDMKKADEFSECLRKTIIAGLPAVHIPSHCPLKINHNVSWSGDIGIARATLNLSNIIWHGIPHWNLTLEQTSEDSDPVAVFPYTLWWKKFVLLAEYTLETNVVLIPGKISGDLNVTLYDNAWKGVVSFNKPGFNITEGISDLDMKWTVGAVDFNFTGLGVADETVSNAMATLVKKYFDSAAETNGLGEAIQKRLNTTWFDHPERIDTILTFCKKNSTVSY